MTPEYRAARKAARANPIAHREAAERDLAEWLTNIASLVRRPEWVATTDEALVLHAGRSWEPGRWPRATYPRMTRNQCFKNAYWLAWWNRDLTYVEGLALPFHGFPTLHAWCVTAAGVVVDPTWTDTDLVVYRGVAIPIETVTRIVFRHGVYGVIANDYRDGAPIHRTGVVDDHGPESATRIAQEPLEARA